MSLSGKLAKWVDAGLITSDQQERILDHERGRSGDRWKQGVVFAGLFSILLGVALIIAANWQDIPWQSKLILHFALNGTLAALVWNWRDKPDARKYREVALFFLWGLTLTLIALIGQTFQLGGQALDAVRVWFWLTAPMILLFTDNAFTARLWALVFLLLVPFDIFRHVEQWTDSENIRLAIGLETAIGMPLVCWLLGSWPRFASARAAMARALRDVGVFMALVGASLVSMVYYTSNTPEYSVLIPAIYAGGAVALRFLLQSVRAWTQDQRGVIDLLCVSGLFVCLPLIAPVDSNLMAMIHFIAFWLLAGAIWQRTGHDRAVSLAVGVITLRLFIGFIELFGSMMMSGFGFIIGGLVLIGLVAGARRLDKQLKRTNA